MAQLRARRSNLRRLVQTCETGDMADCLDLAVLEPAPAAGAPAPGTV
jgi:hypothetical protein